MRRRTFGLIVALGVGVAQPAVVCAQSKQPPDAQQPPAHEKGQCELGKEWSQAKLNDYWPSESRVQSAGALGYMGQSNISSEADLAEARAQVERVVRVSGLEMNFELIVDPSTPAAAEIINGRRVILFDPRFMAQVADRICLTGAQ